MTTPKWINVNDELPPLNRPVPLWGSKLISSDDGVDDYPLMGRLCACHEEWVLEADPDQNDDASEYVERMLGEVTHWLKWWPTPGAAGNE